VVPNLDIDRFIQHFFSFFLSCIEYYTIRHYKNYNMSIFCFFRGFQFHYLKWAKMKNASQQGFSLSRDSNSLSSLICFFFIICLLLNYLGFCTSCFNFKLNNLGCLVFFFSLLLLLLLLFFSLRLGLGLILK
jgi:hypothetical protein